MFKATYTRETLPPLLQYLSGMGRSGKLSCSVSAGIEITLTLDHQRVMTCAWQQLQQTRYGMEAFQLLMNTEGECVFEEGSLPPLDDPRALLGLSMEQLLLRALTVQDIQNVAHIRSYSVPIRQGQPPAHVVSDLIDGKRSVQELAQTLQWEIEELRMELASLEAQQWITFSTGPLLTAESLTHFTYELTKIFGPVTRILMRDAFSALGLTAESFPAAALGDLEHELLRISPAQHQPQVRSLIATLSTSVTHSVREPFQVQHLTDQLTLLIGPIARELVRESLQQIRAPQGDLPTTQVRPFLHSLRALLPSGRHSEALTLLRRIEKDIQV
ncbi:hypothetical protein [Deinococcus sp. QL22]|uniref:hypothetical protein n=1 Tax=Deinococcus sp. QL22 TaxID=2939437 RepID=UPI00201720EC|nr:hypothetical protein [Deinococcus sp. QL22]UQN09245.1 hypothetical protein M1R55_24785 [Deinococcus sp. QL22]